MFEARELIYGVLSGEFSAMQDCRMRVSSWKLNNVVCPKEGIGYLDAKTGGHTVVKSALKGPTSLLTIPFGVKRAEPLIVLPSYRGAYSPPKLQHQPTSPPLRPRRPPTFVASHPSLYVPLISRLRRPNHHTLPPHTASPGGAKSAESPGNPQLPPVKKKKNAVIPIQ